MYVTDMSRMPHLIGSSNDDTDVNPTDFNLKSPKGTIHVSKSGNSWLIDIDKSILDKIGTYVESVKGELVDNTDPQNPVIRVPDAKEIKYNNTKSGLSSKNVQEALDEIVKEFNQKTDLVLKDNGNGRIILKTKTGNILGIVVKSNLTNTINGIYTFDNGDGSPISFDTFDVKINFNSLNNIYEFLDSKGNVIGSIDVNASNIHFDKNGTGITSDNVQGAIEEIDTKLGSINDVFIHRDGSKDFTGNQSMGNNILSDLKKGITMTDAARRDELVNWGGIGW